MSQDGSPIPGTRPRLAGVALTCGPRSAVGRIVFCLTADCALPARILWHLNCRVFLSQFRGTLCSMIHRGGYGIRSVRGSTSPPLDSFRRSRPSQYIAEKAITRTPDVIALSQRVSRRPECVCRRRLRAYEPRRRSVKDVKIMQTRAHFNFGESQIQSVSIIHQVTSRIVLSEDA